MEKALDRSSARPMFALTFSSLLQGLSRLEIGKSLFSIIILVFATKRRQPDTQQDKKATTKASSKSDLVTDLDIFLDRLDAADSVLHVLGNLKESVIVAVLSVQYFGLGLGDGMLLLQDLHHEIFGVDFRLGFLAQTD
jgi:hypothetical protein